MPKTRRYTPNRMRIIFKSGNKTFDNYVVSIRQGQAIGGGVTSLCVRPHAETTCNGRTWKPGELQTADLNNFGNSLRYEWRQAVRNICRERAGLLYVFYHYRGKREIVHGAILMTGDYPKRLVRRFDTGRHKSRLVLDEALKYIADHYDEDGNPSPDVPLYA